MPTDTLQCYLTTEIEKNIVEKHPFNIFPNPTQNILNLSLKDDNSNGVIKIYNLIGELEFESTIAQVQRIIDVSNLLAGIHLIEISNDKYIIRRKFIRQ
jgi:hypothetical protein